MPDEASVAPDDSQTIMMSRSFSEFEEHREALIEIIQSSGLKVARHYELTSGGVIDSSIRLVRNSAALAIIIGPNYGQIVGDSNSNPAQLSLTELEFNEAYRLRRPLLAFVNTHGMAELQTEKLEAFRSRVNAVTQAHFFANLEEFRSRALQAVNDLSKYLRLGAEHLNSQGARTVAIPGWKGWRGGRGSEVADVTPPTPHASVAAEKPLVFISASNNDSEWRTFLERRLDKYKEDIDWWDDSKLEPGMIWQDEIDSARSRASIAVLLLSNDYLNSRNAMAEMAILTTKSKGGLRLFPIVVHECEWQNVAEIRSVQIWDKGRALDRFIDDRKALSLEIQKIAASILKLIGKEQPTPSESIDNFDLENVPTITDAHAFSSHAQLIVDKAHSLKRESGRDRITSSCLFFAFTESEVSRNNPVVHDILNSAQYSTAFKSFLTDSDLGASNAVETLAGMASKNVASVIRYAEKVAFLVSSVKTIHQRHLLAALLNPPGLKGKLGAHRRLTRMGIKRSHYLGNLLKFILSSEPDDDHVEWKSVLAVGAKPVPKPVPKSVPSYREGPAGYTAEFCGVGGERPVPDYLFVGAHANRLAELIALKETKLPLAIGLFGNWGSGKSHFMNLMDRRLKDLMKEEKERSPGSKQKWCREIVPIYFNAWHYLDSNLWASLVAQIFESLFAHLSPRANDLEKVQQLLEQASGAAARAAEELVVAEKLTEQAKKDLAAAEQSRISAETMVDGLLHGLKTLLPEVTLQEVQKQSGELLGIEKEIKTIDDLRRVVDQAGSLRARSQALWKTLWRQPGRAWRITWLLSAVLGGAILATLAAVYLPGLKDWLHSGGRAIAGLLGGLSAVLLWLAPILAAASKRLKQAEEWADKLKLNSDVCAKPRALRKPR